MDNNSTTRVDPRVVEEMLPYFSTHYGNAASRHHSFGWKAEAAVERAREQVAELIGAGAKEIVFTSGATESDNLALKGVASMYRSKGDHIVTAATEHKAVLDPCKRLEREGFRVTFLPVDRFGRVTAEQVAEALTERTILVSIMAANNEVGTLQPIREIGRLCKERGVLFHTDAVQAVGKIPIDVEEMGIDLLSLTAHKIYGPKGIGALYVRRRNPHVRLDPLIDGGGHERGMRSGTLAVPSIVGFGKACAALPGRDAGRGRSAPVLAGTPAPRNHGGADRYVPQRPPDGATAGERQPQLRLRGGGCALDGHEERGRQLRVGMHVGQHRAELRAQGARSLG